ncbi:CbtB domain-containing protein [Rhodoferax sp.]|uniref:CbtB domain-containing protein n=1 Tax=Rhodoferax sp. TaxID=50421 RepID=UPI0025E5988C|nr:CbtB domain-containing protein [Rhodoferax sp.]
MTTPVLSPARPWVGPTAASVLPPLAAAAGLGLALLYGVAFADSPVLHNAAHDVRHITVKPCH